MDLSRHSDFLRLLSCALNGSSAPDGFRAADWQFVFDTACTQSVQGIIFDVVSNLPASGGISPQLAADWFVQLRAIEADYEHICRLVERQRAIWKEHGVDAVLLKGLESAAFYPVPSHRVSGDIDWWMRGSADWEKALEILRCGGISWNVDSDGDIDYTLDGVIVEHHRTGPLDDSPEAGLLFLSEHIFHHASVFGVGLRQICDYALARRRLAVNKTEYRRICRSRGLGRWTELLDSLCDALMAGGPFTGLESEFLGLCLEGNGFGRTSGNTMVPLFFSRAFFYGRLAPGRFARRWMGLAVGRIKRNC